MNGSVRIPNDILLLPLSGAELKTYAVLSALCFANGGKYVKISHSALSAHTGISVSTVRRALSKMAQGGVIDICRTYAEDKCHSNRYRVRRTVCMNRYVSLDLQTVLKLTADKLLIYAGLMMHANTHGICYVSERKLAKKIGLSVPTVRKYTAELKAENMIQKHARYYAKSKQTNARRSFAYVMRGIIDTVKRVFPKKSDNSILKRTVNYIHGILKRAISALQGFICKPKYISKPPPL